MHAMEVAAQEIVANVPQVEEPGTSAGTSHEPGQRPTTGPSDRGVANISAIERSLYKWVGTTPRPPLTGPTDTEQRVAAEEVPGNKTVRQVVVATGALAKTGTRASLKTERLAENMTDKVDLHSRCLIQIKDELSHIRRVLTRYDRPLHGFETATNPTLNPHLNNYVPFDEQYLVNEFFESRERTTELLRYVIHNVPWDVNSFCVNTVRLICTLDYRDGHQFPGKITYEKFTYIPDLLKKFLLSAAQLAASRSTTGGFNVEKCSDQYRGAFHNSAVTRDRKRKSESEVSPSKRRYPYRGFSDTDSSREENRDGQEEPPLTYTSFAELTLTHSQLLGDDTSLQGIGDPDESAVDKE